MQRGRNMIWIYLLALAIPAIIAIVDWSIKDAHVWSKILVITLVVASVAVGVITIKAEDKNQQITKYAGLLNGPSLTVLSTKQDTYPTLKLGDSNTFFTFQGPEGQPIIKVFDDNDLIISGEKVISRNWWKFWSSSESIKWEVSTVIRDKEGQIIAEITNNQWKLKPDKLWDRNYNDNALEVRNADGDIVLQIVVNKDYIQFAAKMYSSTGQGFGIGSEIFTQADLIKHQNGESKIIAAANGPTKIAVGDITGVMEIRPPGQALDLKIEPIFKYPSDLNMGELIKQ